MNQHKIPFKVVFKKISPTFGGLTLILYLYLWIDAPSAGEFLTSVFPHQAALFIAQVYIALYLSGLSGRYAAYSNDNIDDDDDVQLSTSWNSTVNPETGALMPDGPGGVDTMGYTYGNGPEEW
jgi:hypothetical protein